MTIDDVLAALEPLAAIATIGSALASAYNWLKNQRNQSADPNLVEALARLPAGSTANEIVRVVQPFMNAVGGNVALSAGNDGGGNIQATGVTVQGGTGTVKGGDVAIKAGDGGPHGKGGDFTIIGGTIKGGDASGA